jgi:transaldolase
MDEEEESVMSSNPLRRLGELGQSVWYDYIRRDLVTSGELARLIEQDGLHGMTSNPTIFQKAIAETELYDADIRGYAVHGKTPREVFEALAVSDVQRAADVFRRVHERSNGRDGFVSIEVAPRLAHDTAGSIEEARRLFSACDRPNVMVKIPATTEGIPAIRQCLAEGIAINITLLFSVERYREVMEAYLSACEQRVAASRPVDRLPSVASFFVSRVDTNVDRKLDRMAKEASTEGKRILAKKLRGKVAIANARLAFQAFTEVFGGARFAALKNHGARVQRPLWASTSTKDPAYSDLYYVEALVAPDTVATLPPETFAAYRVHGDPKVRIHDDLTEANATFRSLADLGIDQNQVFQELEEEGAKKFSGSVDSLLQVLQEKEQAISNR